MNTTTVTMQNQIPENFIWVRVNTDQILVFAGQGRVNVDFSGLCKNNIGH